MHEILTLPNGARIITRPQAQTRTAAIGFFLGAGSRSETSAENGAAHFIEHMNFKGTHTRTALDIALETDAIGGQINAYTTKESTCFYARCLDSHLPRALDLLADMLLHARFDAADVQLERGVILEEIGMYEDSPEDVCADHLSAAVYKGSSLGRPILGRSSTLSKMDGEFLLRWKAEHYTADRLVVSLSGSFTPEIVETLKAQLAQLPAGTRAAGKPAQFHPAVTARRKATEQNHLILAFPALNYLDERRYQLALLSAILGGGVSSRLFQQLREERGLCYSVYSYISDYADTGSLNICTALNQEMEGQALELMGKIVSELALHGPTDAELERAREQTKANVIMGLESVQARMSHMGTSLLLFERVRTGEEILQAYDAVTKEQLRTLAGEIVRFPNAALSAVGRVSRAEEYQQRLAAMSP